MAKKKKTREKRIPLSPGTAEELKAQRQRFIDKFGREPGPDDPIFFDPSADTPQPINQEVLDQHLRGYAPRRGAPRNHIRVSEDGTARYGGESKVPDKGGVEGMDGRR